MQLPDYFLSLFDESQCPKTITIFDRTAGIGAEYSGIYVDILRNYPQCYEILDTMSEFYSNLSNEPGILFDIKTSQIGLELLSSDESSQGEGDGAWLLRDRVYLFTFQTGEQITVRFSQSYSLSGELVDSSSEIVSILDEAGNEVDAEDIDELEGPSPYIHPSEEPHEDEWLKDLCSFMNMNLKTQRMFYETSETFRCLIRENYYKLEGDKASVLSTVSSEGQKLRYAMDNFKDDKEIVLAAVRNDGLALAHASTRLQDDSEVVVEAVQEKGQSIKYASERFRNDRDIMRIVSSTYGYGLFQYGSDDLKADKELVGLAVQNNPSLLRFLDENLREELNLPRG